MGSLEGITDVTTLNKFLAYSQEHVVLILKHSTTCPISANAYRELEKFSHSREGQQTKIGVVLVIQHRPVSNEIAERTKIQHQSPQALLFLKQNVVWHASHWAISEAAIKEAVKKNVS